MARQLHSYLSGAWYAAPGDGEPIIDPTTGAIVATLRPLAQWAARRCER